MGQEEHEEDDDGWLSNNYIRTWEANVVHIGHAVIVGVECDI